MPAMMPAWSWSLPSVGDTFSTFTCLSVHGQRAVVDELGEVGRPRSWVKLPEITAVPPNDVKRLVVGLDGRRRLHEAVEHDRDLLVELLLGERVPLAAARVGEVHLHRPALTRRRTRPWRCDAALAGEPGLAEVVAGGVLAPGLVGEHHARVALCRRRASSWGSSVSGRDRGVVARRDRGLRLGGARRRASSSWWSPRASSWSSWSPPSPAPPPTAAGVSTGRNRSSAVLPTSAIALSRSFTPGRSMTMSLPWREISGSRVPKLSTRLRMMSMATSRVSDLYLPTGDSTTDMPPWRSRPSTGSWSASERVERTCRR